MRYVLSDYRDLLPLTSSCEILFQHSSWLTFFSNNFLYVMNCIIDLTLRKKDYDEREFLCLKSSD